MEAHLPTLRKILNTMGDDLAWERSFNDPDLGSETSIAVERTEDSVTFTVSERAADSGVRQVMIQGRAKPLASGSMEIDPEGHAAYQSFIEICRLHKVSEGLAGS